MLPYNINSTGMFQIIMRNNTLRYTRLTSSLNNQYCRRKTDYHPIGKNQIKDRWIVVFKLEAGLEYLDINWIAANEIIKLL